MRKPPTIICIQETWLRPTNDLEIPGYTCVRHDRTTGEIGGGVATFVKTGVAFSKINTTDVPESITISIDGLPEKIKITNVYHPQSKPGDPLLPDTYSCFFREKSAIVLGDFNAHSTLFGSLTTDARGRQLEDDIEASAFVLLNTGTPTFVSNATGTTSHLDVAMASAPLARKCTWTVLDDSMGSDHSPILITIEEAVPVEETFIPRWLHRKADWTAFKDDCREALTIDLVTDDIEVSHTAILGSLMEIAMRHIPRTTPPKGKTRSVPYWTDECTRHVRERTEARNKMQKTKDPADAEEYRRIKGITQKVIKDAQKTSWREYCTTLNDKTKLGKVWGTLRKMSGTRSRPAIPTMKKEGRSYTTNQEKANLFGRCFSEVSCTGSHSAEFQERKEAFEAEHSEELHGGHLLTDEKPFNEPFTIQALRIALLRCKKDTSPGEDTITYEILAQLPHPSLLALLELYNMVWEHGRLPACWKNSIVVPILKPKKPAHDANSYRPIALTSVLCKLMERLVTDRLTWQMETNHLFNRFQSGFRRLRSCQDHIVRLQDDIQRAIHAKYTLTGVFVDLEKAFDLMWTDGLLHKLQQHNITGQMFNWIRDFLTDRHIRVRVGAELSELFHMENGSPQGSVISPVLFIIMMNDIPEPKNDVKISLYADDSAIWRAGPNPDVNQRHLQTYLDRLKKFFDDWGFRVSTTKTVAVEFRRSGTPTAHRPLRLGTSRLSYKDSVKFLGVIFDRYLTWSEHIRYVADRCKARLNLMRAIAGSHWGASKDTLLMVYRALIRSVIDYGCIAYESASANQKRVLNTIQCKALTIASGALRGTSLSALQVDCGEMPLHLRRKQQMMEFIMKTEAIPDHPTQTITSGRKSKAAKDDMDPIRVKARNINSEIAKPTIQPLACSTRPMWRLRQPIIDTTLRDKIRDLPNAANAVVVSDSLRRKKTMVEDHIRIYEDHVALYTDGSKNTAGHASCSFYVPSCGHYGSYRMSDGSSVLAAEMEAISRAIEWATSANIPNVVIFSDSLGVLQSLEKQQSGTRQHQLVDLMIAIDDYGQHAESPPKIVWIPGHLGIPGNETADALCKQALHNTAVDIPMTLEYPEARHLYRDHFLRKWQTEWTTSDTGSDYRIVEPNVSLVRKYTDPNRRKEVAITRLRMGHCCLNAQLKLWGRHETGNCDECGDAQETVRHFLLECPTQAGLQDQLLRECARKNWPFDLYTVLSQSSCLDTIYKWLEVSGRKI